ncbi:MAG: hypothetical protein OTJ97_09490, partial [SAR202 cluster bacterium]|nr:hypothetical protein [SAR202 cluster bacterium]
MESTATSLPLIYQRIMLDEKLFPELVNRFREAAIRELEDLKALSEPLDDEIYKTLVPPHLWPVLTHGDRRRSIAAVHKICLRIGWPDKLLAVAIAQGFEAEDRFTEGAGLAEAKVNVQQLDEQPQWIDFLNLPPPNTTNPERKPSAWDDGILQKLEEQVELMITAGRLTEIRPEQVQHACGKIFPKVELKPSGETKIRVLSDERERNSYLQCDYTLQLVGARCHIEWLCASLAPAGQEQTRRIPSSQSRKDLWRQCQQELLNIELARDFSDDQQRMDFIAGKPHGPTLIANHVRRAMAWVNRRSILRKKSMEWERVGDAVSTTFQAGADSTLLNGCLLADSPVASATRCSARPHPESANDPGVGAPEMVTREFSAAYYLVGIRDPSTSPVKFWSVRKNCWRYCESNILNMGGKFSVPSWGRLSNFLAAGAATLCRVVAPIYIDDAAIIAQRSCYETADRAFLALCDACGMVMSPKPEANQSSVANDKVRLLGLNYKWNRPESGFGDVTIHVTVPEATVEKTQEAKRKILAGLNKNRKDVLVEHKDIQRLVGGGTFAACAGGTRAGAELLRPLYKWLDETFFEYHICCERERTNLRLAVKGLGTLLDNPRPIVIKHMDTRRLFVLITDASGRDPTDDGGITEPWLGAMLLDPDGRVRITKRSARVEPVEDAIAILEAKAVAMGISTWKHLLRGNDVLVLTDNQNAAYAFVKLGSRCPRITKVAVDIATWAYQADCMTFFNYIRTDLNPA